MTIPLGGGTGFGRRRCRCRCRCRRGKEGGETHRQVPPPEAAAPVAVLLRGRIRIRIRIRIRRSRGQQRRRQKQQQQQQQQRKLKQKRHARRGGHLPSGGCGEGHRRRAAGCGMRDVGWIGGMASDMRQGMGTEDGSHCPSISIIYIYIYIPLSKGSPPRDAPARAAGGAPPKGGRNAAPLFSPPPFTATRAPPRVPHVRIRTQHNMHHAYTFVVATRLGSIVKYAYYVARIFCTI